MSSPVVDASTGSDPQPTVTAFGDTVRLEVAHGVATLRIDRPKMNALDLATQRGIGAAATSASADDSIAAVVIWGGERVFAAGADVKELAVLGHAEMLATSADIQACFRAVAAIPKPVVAAVNGYALGGGCELAMCADLRFAAADAKLGLPEILLGVIPGAGGTQRLSRLVGVSRAKDLIFSGRQIGADEALQIGLVDRVVPAADVHTTALAWASAFVGGPRIALAAAKAAIDLGSESALSTGLEIERQHFAGLFATEDRRRGMDSFVAEGPGKATFVGR